MEGSPSFPYTPYTAMPSMHFGWALIVAAAWVESLSLQGFLMACVYLPLVFVAIIVTGNHYFLDPIAAIPVVFLAYAIVRLDLLRRSLRESVRVSSVQSIYD